MFRNDAYLHLERSHLLKDLGDHEGIPLDELEILPIALVLRGPKNLAPGPQTRRWLRQPAEFDSVPDANERLPTLRSWLARSPDLGQYVYWQLPLYKLPAVEMMAMHPFWWTCISVAADSSLEKIAETLRRLLVLIDTERDPRNPNVDPRRLQMYYEIAAVMGLIAEEHFRDAAGNKDPSGAALIRKTMKEAGMTSEFVRSWMEEGREEGREEGLEALHTLARNVLPAEVYASLSAITDLNALQAAVQAALLARREAIHPLL